MKFQLGQLLATPGALDALRESEQRPSEFLDRHLSGDWGDVDLEDAQANEDALKNDARIFSVYHTKHGVKVWVITEADRSATTILTPEEY